MPNILDTVVSGFSELNKGVGFVGSLITIFDFFRSRNQDHIQETLNAIRERSKVAYKLYCECREYRKEDLGLPLEKDILRYWESCLERNILPSVEDMVISGIASVEEARILLPCLMEQWMSVPEFSSWLHDIRSEDWIETMAGTLKNSLAILELLSQMREGMVVQEISSMATIIDPGYVNRARHSCNDLDVKNFFTVNNDFHTMLRVVSADEDIPNKEAERMLMELLKKGSPVLIAGNGGQGKTSLMMRAAVKWAFSGGMAVWMSLTNSNGFTEQMADRFFESLLKAVPDGQRVLLCIDNPFEGRGSFSSLKSRWRSNNKIQLLMAERENRLTLLADTDRDLLLQWFDDSSLVILQGIGQNRKYRLKNYTSFYFQEDKERRRAILGKCASYLVKEGVISGKDQLNITNKMLNRYGKPNVSLVELVYRTLFEFKKISSKPESIKLDWEEWGGMIRQEFGNVDTDLQLYGVIAALKVFHTPLSLPLFCRYFELKERRLKNCLSQRSVSRHIEPVFYEEASQTLRPKHDVIAELFFLFHKDKVTINSLMSDLLEVMNENEIENFLMNALNKRDMKQGKNYSIGRIDYWGYMEKIYSRTKKGECNLTQAGRAYLCLGFLWARYQENGRDSSFAIHAVLEDIAPEIESDLLMAKLYTEWGIWAGSEKKDSLAEEKFLAVIKHNPKQLPARTEMGRLLSRQKGREEEAEKYLKEIIEIDPKNIQSRTEIGRLLLKQKGREEEAEKYLKEAIKIDPKHIQSRTEIGRLLSKQKGREEEAEKYLKEAIKIDPKNLHPHTEIGRLLSRQKGREEEAEKYLKEVIEIDPKNLHSRNVLAKLYERMNRLAEARILYQQICEIDPENKFGKDGLSRLEQHWHT